MQSALESHEIELLIVAQVAGSGGSIFFDFKMFKKSSPSLSQAKMLGGSNLASSIELHCGFTAPDVHQVQSETASQEFLSLLSWQTASTSSSGSLSHVKRPGVRAFAASML